MNTNIQADEKRRLSVFLCHSSEDKQAVRDLYKHLTQDGIAPWLDEKNLLPGQDWGQEIKKAVRTSDVVAVCISRSIGKKGFLQKEIREVLDVADQQPEGTIFVIPIKLEECDVPERLQRWQWVNLFEANGYDRLLLALEARASGLSLTLRPHRGSKDQQLPKTVDADQFIFPSCLTVIIVADSVNDGRHFHCTVQTPLLPASKNAPAEPWNLPDVSLL
jgi:hypothetical protein